MQGGLASINNTPIYHPPHRINPARNAFTDNLPVKTNMQIVQPADTSAKSKTPSPQRVTIKVENMSPTGTHKENSVTVAQTGI
jgi:hypothetical protein